METFDLKPEHIALLRHAYVSWNDCETGAPCIDCKRPYGNSSVAADVARVLGEEVPEEQWDLWDATRGEELMKLHFETENALQIVLAFGSFEPGRFVRPNSWSKWERQETTSPSPSTTPS